MKGLMGSAMVMRQGNKMVWEEWVVEFEMS